MGMLSETVHCNLSHKNSLVALHVQLPPSTWLVEATTSGQSSAWSLKIRDIGTLLTDKGEGKCSRLWVTLPVTDPGFIE